MKTKEEIESRVLDIVQAELDKRVAQYSKVLPRNCKNHYDHPLDDQKYLGDGTRNPNYNRISLPVVNSVIGMCTLEDLRICEEESDAKTCRLFQTLYTKDIIWDKFQKELSDIKWVKENMPDLAQLLWVLEKGVFKTPPLTWWKTLKFRLFPIPFEHNSESYVHANVPSSYSSG